MHTEEPPLLQVTGEGSLEVPPDTAVVTVGASTRAETAAAAYQQTAMLMNQVVQALLAMGIPREQMQSQQVALRPIYEKERLVGYQGASTLRVRLMDLAAIGPTIDRAVAAGATDVQGLSFDVREPQAYESRALALAVQDAQRKASAVARSLGIGLGPVWQVAVEPAPGPIMPVMARAPSLEAMPVLPGTLDVTRRVTVAYLVLPS